MLIENPQEDGRRLTADHRVAVQPEDLGTGQWRAHDQRLDVPAYQERACRNDELLAELLVDPPESFRGEPHGPVTRVESATELIESRRARC